MKQEQQYSTGIRKAFEVMVALARGFVGLNILGDAVRVDPVPAREAQHVVEPSASEILRHF